MDAVVTLQTLLEAIQAQGSELRALTAEVAQLRRAVPEVLVDAAEAAKVLGVSPRTLRRYVDAGTVPFRRMGRALRFPLAGLKPPTLA